MSDKIDIMLNSGDNISLPTWALETTQKEVVTALVALNKTMDGGRRLEAETKALTEKMFKEIKTGNKDEKEATKEKVKVDKEAIQASKEVAERIKENKKALEDFKSKGPMSIMEKTIDNLESDFETVGNTLGIVADKALLAGAVIVGSLASGATFVGNALLGAGHELNELTKSGVGFNNTFAEVGKGATEGIAGLGALGVGFKGAADLIKNSSNVVATAGFGKFQSTMKFAADSSEELGMSFEDSMETFGQVMSRRQKVMDLGNVSQGALNKTITGTITAQRVYSQALGVSSTELEIFVNSLTQNNGLLTSTLLTMNSGIRNQVMGGIEVFASGLAALGGPMGENIAEAFTDAASAGAIGLSQEAVGYITALPSLAGPMNEYIAAVQGGTLSQDQAQNMVTDLTMSLGNLSSQEKQRIKSLAAIGDESAKEMARAIAQFEQSENKIKELNKQFGTAFDMDKVQTGTNEFNKVLNQAKGAFSNAFYSLFADPGVIGALNDGLKEIMGVFGFATDDMSGAAMDAGSLVKGLAEKAIPVIKSIMESVKGFAEYLKEGFEDGGISGMIGNLLKDAAGMIIKALVVNGIKLAALMFAGRFAVEWAKTSLMPQAKAFGLKMFQGGAGVGKQLMQQASGWMKGLFDPKNSNKLASFVQKNSGRLKDMAGKVAGSDMGKKVSDKLGSFQKDGAKMTDKLSGAMTKGGSSGGFLKSIADGVKKFGDTKVVKGAASLALLGASITLAAIGLKKFNEVDAGSIVKGTIALGGLVGLTKLLGKGSSAMIKGAAAVAILGASVVPMAFGLSLMKDVGLDTIGVMAAGLVVLTAAAVGMGFALPFILLGAVAIAALGTALIPLGFGLKLVSESLPGFVDSLAGFSEVDGVGLLKSAGGMLAIAGAMALMAPLLPFMLLGSLAGPSIKSMGESLQTFNDVNFGNLALAGVGMKAIAEGMAAMSGGSLKSSMMDGIGSIFGADSPMDKLKSFVQGFESINFDAIHLTADALSTLSDSLMDLSFTMNMAAPQFEKLAKAMDSISAGSLVKMAAIKAMGAFGIGTGQQAGPQTVQQAGPSPKEMAYGATPVAGAGGPQNTIMPVGTTNVGNAGNLLTNASMSTSGIDVPMNSVKPTSIQSGFGASYGDDIDDDFSDSSMPATGPNGMKVPDSMPKAKLADPNDPNADKSSVDIMIEKMDRQLEVQTALLEAQTQNNRIGKKTQRNIEGLEI